MEHIFSLVQIISAPLMIALILLQRPDADVGGTTDSGSFMQTRRGFERFIFIFTIIVAIVFALSSLLVVVLAH